jgi:hypothetical protein
MKNTVLTVFLLISLVGNAQKGAHNVSLGLSNNGQIAAAMTHYYFVWFYTADVPEYKRLELKTDFTYSYATANGLEFGLAAGYGQRKEKYEGTHLETKVSQQYASAMPFFLRGWQFRQFQISAGGGIPCYRIGDYNARLLNDSPGASMHITGGGAIGVSGLVRMKWSFTERFSLNGLVNFGVLYMDYGKENLFYNYDSQGNITGTAVSLSKQQRVVIPSPELLLSIGFRI